MVWKFGPSNIQTPLTPQNITLTYWGLWEEEAAVRPLLEEYKKLHPNISINYVRHSSVNYRTKVQTQIREGAGPDVFWIHNSWLPMFVTDLSPTPNEVFSFQEYQSTFYPVMSESFVRNNQIYAAPFGIDGLALFYNEEILAGTGINVPKNWQEFIDASVRTTVKDTSGQILTAGAAMGTAGNVDNWSDILGLLLLQQPGVNLLSNNPNIATPAVAEVMKFYTGFVTDPKRQTWDATMPSSTQAFAQNRLTFYIAPSWRAYELRQINPNLKFKVAPIPQLSGNPVGWASFWAQAVSAKSKYPDESWKFVKFLSSKQAEQTAYRQASQVRLFGEPYSRADLVPELTNDPIVGAFVNQGPIYKFWYLSSNTFDNGINDEMIKYWEDGVNATLAGTDPQIALQTVEQGVRQVLNKYFNSQSVQTQ